MFENEDMILPDDFQDAQPQAEGTIETPVSEEVDTFETEQTEELMDTQEQPIDEIPKIKVKYNHEEQELSYDDAVPLIQKGMNYDKLQERLQALETDPRLSFVEDMADQFGMTVPEYLDAVKQQREQDQLNELIQNNIPEDLAQEILESRKDRESRKQQEKEQAEEQKRNAEGIEFFNYFKQANGRDFDPSKDKIPQEVWEANANGVPLKYAFMEHHNSQLKSQLQVFKQNEENAKKSPIGSISSHGSTEVASEDDFLRGFNSI